VTGNKGKPLHRPNVLNKAGRPLKSDQDTQEKVEFTLVVREGSGQGSRSGGSTGECRKVGRKSLDETISWGGKRRQQKKGMGRNWARSHVHLTNALWQNTHRSCAGRGRVGGGDSSGLKTSGPSTVSTSA